MDAPIGDHQRGELLLELLSEEIPARMQRRAIDDLVGLVRDKLRGIVLRADVGITEQAWEVREEELDRVRSLQTERARQEQLLDEELKEVRDDGVEPGQSAK